MLGAKLARYIFKDNKNSTAALVDAVLVSLQLTMDKCVPLLIFCMNLFQINITTPQIFVFWFFLNFLNFFLQIFFHLKLIFDVLID